MENIREKIENNERLILSDKACLSTASLGRDRDEQECQIRTCFQKDRDKIIHSRTFRNLKHKTQVFLFPLQDTYRTRLTHTLEVSQISRTIARALALNEDLTEAIALGHDVGHTPFGHTGESALNAFNPDGFKHYAQSVRVLEKIENDGRGLNLSYEIKDGIITHTVGDACTLEGQIVKIADKIAYINHDIEDATLAEVISDEDIPLEFKEKFGFTKAERIDTMVFNIIENSVDKIQMAKDYEEMFFKFHEYMYSDVYFSEICRSQEKKAIGVISALCEHYYKHPDEMPTLYQKIAERDGLYAAVCDYISGMSDNFAKNKYEEIFVPAFWIK